jgi:hypothetical protein
MTNNLIILNIALPQVTTNFDDLEKSVDLELQKYNFVVTPENEKLAKEKATELNKMFVEIETQRKNLVKELNTPIKKLDDDLKGLSVKIQNGRQAILGQLEVFANERRALCEKLCQELLIELYAEYGIEKEFQTVVFSDLVIVSNITEKGSLAKIARDGIASRVNEALIKQDTVKSRINSLKSRCETAGLKVEFSHNDIKHFISEPEATYNEKLDAMISRAVDTQNKLSAKLEKDAQEKLEKEKAKVQMINIETQSASNISEEKPTQSTDEVFVVEVKMQLKLDKMTYEYLIKNGNNALIPNIKKCFQTYIQNSCSFKKI